MYIYSYVHLGHCMFRLVATATMTQKNATGCTSTWPRYRVIVEGKASSVAHESRESTARRTCATWSQCF